MVTSEAVSLRTAEIRAKLKKTGFGLGRVTKPVGNKHPETEHQRSIGRQGGLSKSIAKITASRANLQKAMEKRRFLCPSPKTNAERQSAYRQRTLVHLS